MDGAACFVYKGAKMATPDDKPAKHELPKYPANHPVGMRVPRGGSSCAKCSFVRHADRDCANASFVRWNGSHRLPAPANAYCCDFFDTRTAPRGAAELRAEK